MRTIKLSTVAVLAVLVAACPATPGTTTATAEDEAALRTSSEAWATAWNARDAAAMAALMSDDYHEVTPMGQHFTSASDAQANLADELAQMPTGVTIELDTEYTTFIDGNNAYAGGTWTTSGMPAGMPTKGSWLVIYVKDSTGWKIASGLGSTDVTPLMPAPPAEDAAP
jgi:uncharacterized protein (TIGR02246 family)